MAGAEIRRHARNLLHPDGARQARVQPRPQLRGRHADARRQEEADHLPPRVHTRIRAPRRLQPQLLCGTTAAALRAAAAVLGSNIVTARGTRFEISLLWNCGFGQAAGQCLAVICTLPQRLQHSHQLHVEQQACVTWRVCSAMRERARLQGC